MSEDVLINIISKIKLKKRKMLLCDDVFSLYKKKCKECGVSPITDKFLFYKIVLRNKKNIWLTIGDDGKPYFMYMRD